MPRRAIQSEICAPDKKQAADIDSGRRVIHAPRPQKAPLALGELEALARALLAVFLAFVFARIASQQTRFLERGTQFGVKRNQCAGNTQLNCPSLAGNPASICKNQQIDPLRHFDSKQGSPNGYASRFGREIVVESTAIDGNFARSGPQEHARHAAFAAAGSQILLNLL